MTFRVSILPCSDQLYAFWKILVNVIVQVLYRDITRPTSPLSWIFFKHFKYKHNIIPFYREPWFCLSLNLQWWHYYNYNSSMTRTEKLWWWFCFVLWQSIISSKEILPDFIYPSIRLGYFLKETTNSAKDLLQTMVKNPWLWLAVPKFLNKIDRTTSYIYIYDRGNGMA